MKRQLIDKVTNLENEMKMQLTETQKELRRKFTEQEEKSKKSSSASEQRQVLTLKQNLDQAITKINEMFTN